MLILKRKPIIIAICEVTGSCCHVVAIVNICRLAPRMITCLTMGDDSLSVGIVNSSFLYDKTMGVHKDGNE